MIPVLKETPSWTTQDGKIHTNYLVALKHEITCWVKKATDNEVAARLIADALSSESVAFLIAYLTLVSKELAEPSVFRVVEGNGDSQAQLTYQGDDLMAVVNPVHPGLTMQNTLAGLSLRISEAAVILKMDGAYLNAMLTKNEPVSLADAFRFEAAFGGADPMTLHAMSDAYENVKAMEQREQIVGDIVRFNRVEQFPPVV